MPIHIGQQLSICEFARRDFASDLRGEMAHASILPKPAVKGILSDLKDFTSGTPRPAIEDEGDYAFS